MHFSSSYIREKCWKIVIFIGPNASVLVQKSNQKYYYYYTDILKLRMEICQTTDPINNSNNFIFHNKKKV